jgi:mannose-6-phosphate isomerase-like protein (cupin superfamily)
MIIHKSKVPVKMLDKCHDGVGVLHCTEYLGEYGRKEKGIKFYHDNMLNPGVSVGEHTHENDEEMYIILNGIGVMKIDGKDQNVKDGDVCITRRGHSHSLANTGTIPMRFLVVGVNS